MFLEFYGMGEQPFGVTPDPRFLFLGKSHREALASLYYGIRCNRGFVALIAPPGSGKTTLCFQLVEKLQGDSRTVFLFQTPNSPTDLFRQILQALGIETDGMDVVSMHNTLNGFLMREAITGRRFILAIDEAQTISSEVLEAIRLLSNFETPTEKLLEIVLIGQPALARTLAAPELEQLQQRISAFASLEPFDADETRHYIEHRVAVAGYRGAPLFTSEAFELIERHSQGIPRKINALCFSALSLGCAMGRKQVDAEMVREAITDRDIVRLQSPKPVPVPLAVTPAPSRASPVLTNAGGDAKPSRAVGKWAVGAIVVAACVAVAIGAVALSPTRVNRSVYVASEAWSSIRNRAESIRSLLVPKSRVVAMPATLDAQAASQPAPASDEVAKPGSSVPIVGLTSVVVQSGDTVRQILLRNSLAYDSATLASLQALNPTIADINHLEVGEKIQLPSGSASTASSAASDATNRASHSNE